MHRILVFVQLMINNKVAASIIVQREIAWHVVRNVGIQSVVEEGS